MSFFIINREPVFIPWNRYRELSREFTKDKDPIDKISAHIEGEANNELSRMFLDYLDKEYENNPEEFDNEYANFSLKGEDAKDNIWNLIYDYSVFYNFPLLYDARNFPEILTKNFSEFTHPMGDVFYLKFKTPIISKKILFFLIKQDYHETMIQIDCKKINTIVGNLKEFEITTETYKLIFRPNLITCE